MVVVCFVLYRRDPDAPSNCIPVAAAGYKTRVKRGVTSLKEILAR